jgi:putative FmdB family regulatory protein
MPIYEYECPHCKTIHEKYTPIDANVSNCPVCDRNCQRIISKTHFRLTGSCWAKDNYSSKKED